MVGAPTQGIMCLTQALATVFLLPYKHTYQEISIRIFMTMLGLFIVVTNWKHPKSLPIIKHERTCGIFTKWGNCPAVKITSKYTH